MKFYGNGLVWDSTENKPLVRFVGGACDADGKTAKTLIKLGFKHDAPDKQETDDYSSMTVDELKRQLTEIGIDFQTDSKKADLIKLLEGAG